MAIGIHLPIWELFGPLNLVDILDAVLRQPGCTGNGAAIVGGYFGQCRQYTLIAARLIRLDNHTLPTEILGSTINQEPLGALHDIAIIIELHELMYEFVEPPPRLHIVQASNNDGELAVEAAWLVLDLALVGDDLHTAYPFHHEISGHFGFVPADVLLAEQELAVQVCEVDCVQVDYVDLVEA